MHRALSAAFIALTIASPAYAQRDFSNVEIETTQVADGIYMLKGAGGNIGLSVGSDGAFLIDDQFAPLSGKIMAAIRTLTDDPVEFILNTHHHGDHTGGNEAFGKSGSHIVAHDNVRKRLVASGKSAPEALPVITFSETTTFHYNDHEIYLFHPKNAHTDGDAIVYFRDMNVIHMGDAFFADHYPYVDTANGGSLNGYIEGLETAASMADSNTKIIPGHGALSTKADLDASIEMLKLVRSRVQALIDNGLNEDAIVAAAPLADLDEKWSWNFISGERMTRAAFQSLTTE